jgi:hypothetical protein
MPRMLLWAVLTVILIALTFAEQNAYPSSVIAVTLYKAHLMALGGWGGYWLDRALFPYDRPHQYLDADEHDHLRLDRPPNDAQLEMAVGTAFGSSMLRRAIIVAACLICVGLGA